MIVDIHPHVVSTDTIRYPNAPVGGHKSDWSRDRPVSVEQMIAAKGGAGVAGSAIVILATTLSATGVVPVASVGLILGVHSLLSSAFVPVNVLGNSLATIVIGRTERAVDMQTLQSELQSGPEEAAPASAL